MKKYLVTGCAGFIGSNFVYYMLKKYDDILLVNLDKLTYAGNLENLKGVPKEKRGAQFVCQLGLYTSEGKYYSVEAEKRFPKIRISQSDYDRLKRIQEECHYKSLGQAISRLLSTYNNYVNKSKLHSLSSHPFKRFSLPKKSHSFPLQQQ